MQAGLGLISDLGLDSGASLRGGEERARLDSGREEIKGRETGILKNPVKLVDKISSLTHCAQLTWPSRFLCTMRAGELGRRKITGR